MPKNRWTRAVARLSLGGWLWVGPALLSAGSSPAGSAFLVERVPEEWLPQSSVIAITQTHDGYLWLGTLNGLVRFDGLKPAVFKPSNTPGLASSEIVFLFEDSRSNLWVGTKSAGMSLVKPDGAIQRVNIPSGNAIGPVVSASEDAAGAIWLNTVDGLVMRYLGDRMEVLNARARPVLSENPGPLWLGLSTQFVAIATISNTFTFVVERQLPVSRLDFLLASAKHGFWRLADGRVQKWQRGQVERDLGEYPWGSARVIAACEDQEGCLIVGTLGSGVFWYDAEGRSVQISAADGLSHDTVLSLWLDREDTLWVGTDGGGLNRVRRRMFNTLESSAGRTIQSVWGDGEGGVWFANFGYMLNHWRNGRLTQYGVNEGLFDTNILSVLVDRSTNVWVGTMFGGLFVLHDGQFRQVLGGPAAVNPRISALHQDRNGTLWVGTQAGLAGYDGKDWTLYTTAEGLSANDVRTLADDSTGNLWIGTDGGGLNCLKDGQITSIHTNNGLPSDSVSALYVDQKDVLWVGTAGAGLTRYHLGKWTRYATRDSVLGGNIACLLEDDQGYLWMGSDAGLMRVSERALEDFAAGRLDTVRFRVYGKAEGLLTRECTQGSQPAACRTLDGRLWFCTIKGLVWVDPAEVKPNTHAPPVIIESVLIDGQEQNTNALYPGLLRAVTVPPRKERLEIQYTSLNLSAPQGARFRYRLEGHENAWIEANDSRVARYSNLSPGDYRFHVIASNEDGVWNESGAVLAVTVLPPFWRAWWFLGLSGASVFLIVVVVVRFIATQKLQHQLAVLKQQETLERERGRIARDLHDQLGANLTQVAILGEMAVADRHEPGEVEAHARGISQTARETTIALDEIVWAVNPSNDSLEGLINYACKYAQDYLAMAGLRYRLDVPTQLPEIGITPDVRHNVFLAFKESVNNVVKHAKASETWIRLKLEEGGFRIEIQDNGCGLDRAAEDKGRNGLRNMRRRMEDVGGSCSIDSVPGGGTRVTLAVPLRKR